MIHMFELILLCYQSVHDSCQDDFDFELLTDVEQPWKTLIAKISNLWLFPEDSAGHLNYPDEDLLQWQEIIDANCKLRSQQKEDIFASHWRLGEWKMISELTLSASSLYWGSDALVFIVSECHVTLARKVTTLNDASIKFET